MSIMFTTFPLIGESRSICINCFGTFWDLQKQTGFILHTFRGKVIPEKGHTYPELYTAVPVLVNYQTCCGTTTQYCSRLLEFFHSEGSEVNEICAKLYKQ